ncbi:hypothetical protein [Niastella populi]|uniref:Outer membrane protein beta-barrel domain-containing protein n=1 Tax=Niastella populi TaxID=550983 RepID=A0A1V9F7U6_9BACT|nr:hypothetical protein [Niastella populi]OQP54385.1 hypothetical protein A4R26_27890 [Niastella populi]
MKKLFTLMIVLQSVIIEAKSQIQAGNVMVGADIADFNLGLNEGSNFSIFLDPKLAYFFTDNLAVGGYLKFGLVTSKGAGESIDYGLGLLGRYYLSKDINVVRNSRFFVEANAGIEGTNPASGENTNGLGLGFGPGWTYFLTPNVGLEALIKYNGIVGFGERATSSNLLLSVGFQIYIPSAKLERRLREATN